MGIKSFVNIRNPLFHGTNGPKMASIVLRKEGIVSKECFRSKCKTPQYGISLSRGLDTAFDFGNYVAVIDGDKLKGKIFPMQYGGSSWKDEMEERFSGTVPFASIVAVVKSGKASKLERREWKSIDIPFIQKDSGKYKRIN